MPRDYLNNVVGIGYGTAEPGQPGHDYGTPGHPKPRHTDQHLPTLRHEAFLEWMRLNRPKDYDRLMGGVMIPTRRGEELLAEWYTAPPDDTLTQLWRSLNRASRDKLYAEADELGRKVYDELNAAYPLEE